MQPPAPPHQQRAPTKTLGISQSDASAARLTHSVQIRKSKKQRRTADRRKLPSLSTVTFAELEVHLNNFLSDPSYRRAPNLDKFIALMSQPHGLYPLELLNQCIPHLTSLLPVTISVFQTLSASFPPKTLHLEHIIPYVSPPHSLVIRNIAVRIFSNCAATAEGRQLTTSFGIVKTLCDILFDVDPATVPTSSQTYEDIMFFFSNQALMTHHINDCDHCYKILREYAGPGLLDAQGLEAFYWFLCFMSGNEDFYFRRPSVMEDFKVLKDNQKDIEPWLRYVGNVLSSGDGWTELALLLPLEDMDVHVLRGLVMSDGGGGDRVMEYCLAQGRKYAEVVYNGVKRGWRRGIVEWVREALIVCNQMEETKWLIEICRVALQSVEEWDEVREGVEKVMEDWEGKNDDLVERACDVVDHWEEEEEAADVGAALLQPEVQGNMFKFGVNPNQTQNQPFDFSGGGGGGGGGGQQRQQFAPPSQAQAQGRGRGVNNKPSWMT
ncbi:hypothetical protein TrVE_jg9389 [Triparma verrucosa]|uniref:Uncharacterized protein n=1 Tax=Triparma verrucosa TaxID=1606542 RepID=A0A9W6Z6V7_9STRA|nr:hypothetical protein TrVE_jg9389 [Triparma verrucosa]